MRSRVAKMVDAHRCLRCAYTLKRIISLYTLKSISVEVRVLPLEPNYDEYLL